MTVSSFIIVGYVWQILEMRGLFAPPSPIREQHRKCPSWIGLNYMCCLQHLYIPLFNALTLWYLLSFTYLFSIFSLQIWHSFAISYESCCSLFNNYIFLFLKLMILCDVLRIHKTFSCNLQLVYIMTILYAFKWWYFSCMMIINIYFHILFYVI